MTKNINDMGMEDSKDMSSIVTGTFKAGDVNLGTDLKGPASALDKPNHDAGDVLNDTLNRYSN